MSKLGKSEQKNQAPKGKSQKKGTRVYRNIEVFLSSKLFLMLTVGWFFVQTFFIALTTKFGLPPDENYHFNLIKLFTENGWSPILSNQDGYFFLGEVVKSPYFLYHYLMSIPNHAFSVLGGELFLLRLTNVALAGVCLFVIYKILTKLNFSSLIKNISIFFITNTLMFVFISASVSYDVLFLLASLVSVYLVLTLKELEFGKLVYLFTVIIGGVMIKKTFIPVAILVLSALIFQHRKSLGSDVKSLKKSIPKSKLRLAVLLVPMVIVLGLFVQRFVLNTFQYGSFDPDCTKVLRIETCRESALFVRNEKIANSSRPPATKGVVEYTQDWLNLMGGRLYGVFAHEDFPPFAKVFLAIQIFWALGVIAYIRKVDFKGDSAILALSWYAFGYLIILMLENYQRYKQYSNFTLAVQGRYALFAVMMFYPILLVYTDKLFKDKRYLITIYILLIGTFFLSSLPSYLERIDQGWLNQNSSELVQKIK